MNDVLPADIGAWQHLERTTRELFAAYGFEEMRVPLVEQTTLFKRSIGEFTDIVEKEMFTFTEADGESLTLRPEATAGIARAAITNGLLRGARLKLWTIGTDVPARAAAAGPLPAVLPDRCGSAGLRWPGYRHRAHCDDRAPVAHPRHPARAAEAQFTGHTGVAPRLSREAGGVFHAARRFARCRQPAAPRRQSAAHPRHQEPRHAGRGQRRAAAVRISGCRIARAFRRVVRHACRDGHRLRRRSAAGTRPRLLLAHGVRMGHRRAWVRRTPSARVVATTA